MAACASALQSTNMLTLKSFWPTWNEVALQVLVQHIASAYISQQVLVSQILILRNTLRFANLKRSGQMKRTFVSGSHAQKWKVVPHCWSTGAGGTALPSALPHAVWGTPPVFHAVSKTRHPADILLSQWHPEAQKRSQPPILHKYDGKTVTHQQSRQTNKSQLQARWLCFCKTVLNKTEIDHMFS